MLLKNLWLIWLEKSYELLLAFVDYLPFSTKYHPCCLLQLAELFNHGKQFLGCDFRFDEICVGVLFHGET